MATKGRNRGQVETLSANRFRARIYTGTDSAGKRIYQTVGIYPTVKQAQVARDKALAEQDVGTYVAPSRILMRDYMQSWLDGLLTDVAATKRGYAERTKRIVASLGAVRLDRLSREQIKAFYASLAADGLSPRTIQYTHQTLRLALSEAVLARRLSHNPTDKITLPKVDKRHAALVKVFTEAETDTLLRWTLEHEVEWYALFYTLLHTGMRPGEAAGLRWSDFDAGEHPSLAIRRVVDSEGIKERAKTDKSRRTVRLTEEHTRVLEAHRKRQLEVILKAGPAYDRTGNYIFADSRTGAYLPMKQWLRPRWARACKEAGVPEINPYGARHTHATRLLEANVNPKLVAERLGNSARVVMEVYSHVLPKAQDAVVAALEKQQANR